MTRSILSAPSGIVSPGLRVRYGGRRRRRSWSTHWLGVRLGPLVRRELTVRELHDEFLAQHIAEPSTITTLRSQLTHVVTAFGERPLDVCSFRTPGVA